MRVRTAGDEGRPGVGPGLQCPRPPDCSPGCLEEPSSPGLCCAQILGSVFVEIVHVQTFVPCAAHDHTSTGEIHPSCSLAQIVTYLCVVPAPESSSGCTGLWNLVVRKAAPHAFLGSRRLRPFRCPYFLGCPCLKTLE